MANVTMTRYIVDRLKEAESQEDKKIVLERYASDTLIKRILHLTYNPLIIFGMDDYTLKKDSSGIEGGMGISKFMHIPEDLYHNKLDDKEAIFACNLVLGHINIDEVEIFIGMLKKDIGVGLSVDTINSVWPDLIPTFPIQYPNEYSDELIAKYEWPAVVQKYYKGKRVNIICRFNNIKIYTEDGIETSEYDSAKDQFQTLAQNQGIVFDGCVIEDKFIIWDAIKYDGFIKGFDNRLGYNWRYNGIEHMVYQASTQNTDPIYSLPEQKIVYTLEEAKNATKEINSDVIVKNFSGTWKNGISDEQLIIRV